MFGLSFRLHQFIMHMRSEGSGELLFLAGAISIKISYASSYILSETSKPPLDIFSYILTYMIHT